MNIKISKIKNEQNSCICSEVAELTQSCGAQLTNKTHFYCEKLNSYEHLEILWENAPSAPLVPSPLLFADSLNEKHFTLN